ncbi:RNA methyltransferase [Listeria floridensis FSL S10-1187]|uniref:RNA methyltransferase n=1 Tax=Listeria floridensis FSL S10-1187 TaxID=1265817 RepID=A0ABN0RDN8_9LIST|nr:23S rRNA (uracil(1939)-C(5))-methyltransferase RlmD [Listeria floridensis]EUJ29141.1 RNA methyltransferase [Listeria floridensis FSL S10-1187]
MNRTVVEVGQEFPLKIKRMGINGEGIGYYKQAVVFVPGALTGEEVIVEVTKTHKNYNEAFVKKIRRKSELRVVPPCPIYETCGGCELQHLAYSGQLDLKKDLLIQALEKHTNFKIEKLKIRDTIGMDEPFRYRNKSQFQARMLDGRLKTGLFGANSHDLVPIEDCLVQDPRTVRITNAVRDHLNDLGIKAYNERKKTGVIRTIVVRVGVETKEVQLVLVTTREKFHGKEELVARITAEFPEIVSLMQNINPDETSLIFGADTVRLAGKDKMTEKLMEQQFDLSARAFFQLNPSQTNKLYAEVRNALTLTGNESLVDAYCGAGTIGLSLAEDVREVRGMDTVRDAILDAQENALKNGVENAEYVVGAAEQVFSDWQKEGYKPDAVVVDPPRVGLDDELLRAILSAKPKQLVYVSCNPSTLARDLAVLEKRYRIRYLQPIDMFPMTAQVECVVKLTLKSNPKRNK